MQSAALVQSGYFELDRLSVLILERAAVADSGVAMTASFPTYLPAQTRTQGAAGRPPPADSAEGVAYFFFALHFWTDVELLLEPSEKDSVPVCDHFFFLQRAMT
jgi:hypothetical protein